MQTVRMATCPLVCIAITPCPLEGAGTRPCLHTPASTTPNTLAYICYVFVALHSIRSLLAECVAPVCCTGSGYNAEGALLFFILSLLVLLVFDAQATTAQVGQRAGCPATGASLCQSSTASLARTAAGT